MAAFVWSEKFVTGIELIDRQHQRLVELLNGFGELSPENPVEGALFPNVFNARRHAKE